MTKCSTASKPLCITSRCKRTHNEVPFCLLTCPLRHVRQGPNACPPFVRSLVPVPRLCLAHTRALPQHLLPHCSNRFLLLSNHNAPSASVRRHALACCCSRITYAAGYALHRLRRAARGCRAPRGTRPQCARARRSRAGAHPRGLHAAHEYCASPASKHRAHRLRRGADGRCGAPL